MIKAIIEKRILQDGSVLPSISTPSMIDEEICSDELLQGDEKLLREDEFTPSLVKMLARAYETGYREALLDARRAVLMIGLDEDYDKRDICAPSVSMDDIVVKDDRLIFNK